MYCHCTGVCVCVCVCACVRVCGEGEIKQVLATRTDTGPLSVPTQGVRWPCRRSVRERAGAGFLPCVDPRVPSSPPSRRHHCQPGAQHSMLFCAQRLMRLWYADLSCVKSCAASGFAGEFGLGSHSSDWMDERMVQMLWHGLHWSWMMSKHSVPSEYTFGWNTVRKAGGRAGGRRRCKHARGVQDRLASAAVAQRAKRGTPPPSPRPPVRAERYRSRARGGVAPCAPGRRARHAPSDVKRTRGGFSG